MVRCFRRKGESIPNGWGADKHGNETNIPSEVMDGGGLLPLGGNEMSSGYKGELFCHNKPPGGKFDASLFVDFSTRGLRPRRFHPRSLVALKQY